MRASGERPSVVAQWQIARLRQNHGVVVLRFHVMLTYEAGFYSRKPQANAPKLFTLLARFYLVIRRLVQACLALLRLIQSCQVQPSCLVRFCQTGVCP